MLPHEQSFLIPFHCDLCGGPMKLIRKISAPDAQSELAVYQCEQCRHTVTLPAQDEAR
jgi:predicted SprT family Zn-dependent metalloprotease